MAFKKRPAKKRRTSVKVSVKVSVPTSVLVSVKPSRTRVYDDDQDDLILIPIRRK